MQQTPNLKLEKYELDDMASLTDGYNRSMDLLDEYAGGVNDKFPITSADIEDGTIETVDLANGCVTDNKLATASVTSTKIASQAVTNEALKDKSVTNEKIAEDSVTAVNIVDGEIGDAQIGDQVIQLDKMNPNVFDATPTEDSPNIPTSGGVWEAIRNLTAIVKAQQQNGHYTSVPLELQPGIINKSLEILKSDNGAYFFLTDGYEIPSAGIAGSAIPGTTYYGYKLCKIVPNGLPAAQAYNGVCVQWRTDTWSFYRSIRLIIGTDGYLYQFSSRNSPDPVVENFPLRVVFEQSKLTLNQLDINLSESEITNMVEDLNHMAEQELHEWEV